MKPHDSYQTVLNTMEQAARVMKLRRTIWRPSSILSGSLK